MNRVKTLFLKAISVGSHPELSEGKKFALQTAGKGTGLGLSISKSIIEKNGGTFYYDQTSTHTRFVIDLPGVTESA